MKQLECRSEPGQVGAVLSLLRIVLGWPIYSAQNSVVAVAALSPAIFEPARNHRRLDSFAPWYAGRRAAAGREVAALR